MNFASLCDFFDNVRNAKSLSEKTQLTENFMKDVRQNHHEIFPILRLVVPKLDRDRPSYKIKESKISKLLIKMLGLPPGNDKNALLKSVVGSSIGFSEVIYSVLKKYIVSKEIGMTVQKLNEYLDQIANRTTDNGLDDLILEILHKLSAKNTKWLIQIILKSLELGISDKRILACFHPDAANFYDMNNNLKKVCDVLSDPKIKLHELEINIFEPFRPMLSKRCDASNFKKCFPDGKLFLIENKFDGERFQLHMDNGKFKYFSRNGYDFTDSYGASYDEGNFTPLLKNVFDDECKRLILDGEMMLWNTKTNNFGSKGMNYDVKKLNNKTYKPCFCVFDILLFNDKILTNQPLQKRLNLLKKVIKNPVIGTLVLSEYKEAHSHDDIVNSLNSSVDNNEEGIVVKDPKSIYKYSDRNSGWFKIKMEYFDDVVHDLDVIVMGGTYGSGKIMNSFIVGISSGPDTYLSLGSISSGLNAEQLNILTEKLESEGLDFKLFSTKSEGKLHFGRETPDVYIEPQNSYVLTIRATELIKTASDHVKTPYTLRFPRVLSIRQDKNVEECLSINELLQLTSQNKSVIKLNKRHIELTEIVSKVKPPKRIKLEVVGLTKRREKGDFLKGKRFHVHSGSESWGIEDIYFNIKRAGGEVSYRLEPTVDFVLVSEPSANIINLMKQPNNFDIIHTDWFKRVLDQRELIDYKQNEIFSLGLNFQRDLSTNFDKFGDSFVEEATKDSLKFVFNLMKQRDEFLNVNNSVVFNDKTQIFEQYTAYFDKYEEINNGNSKEIYYSFPDEIEFQYYGGFVSKEVTSDVNLIIVKDNDGGRISLLKSFLESQRLDGLIKIVGKDFLKRQIQDVKN